MKEIKHVALFVISTLRINTNEEDTSNSIGKVLKSSYMVSLNCAIMSDFSCRIGDECKAHCGDLRWAEYVFVIEESVCLIRAICLRLQMSLSPLLLSTSTIVRWPYLKRIISRYYFLPDTYHHHHHHHHLFTYQHELSLGYIFINQSSRKLHVLLTYFSILVCVNKCR